MTSLMTHRLMRLFIAALIGASTTLSFAPFSLWPFAIISPLLLILLIKGQSAKYAACIGYIWGIGLFATGVSWVHVSIDTFGGMPKIASLFLMALLVGYLSIYSALFAALISKFKGQKSLLTNLLIVPALWLITDWLRGWVMTGFPWLLLGYSQIEGPLEHLAPIGGVDLITFFIIAIASTLSYAISHKSWRSVSVPLLVFSLGWLTQLATWVTPEPEKAQTVALIQGNISQELKWLPRYRWPTLLKYMDHTRENWDADIIIWPEAAIPAFEDEITQFMQTVDLQARDNDTAVITGVLTRENGQYFNSVTTLGTNPNGEYDYETQHRYQKHHLLPFGEFVPFEEFLRPLAPFFNLPMSSFNRGDYIQDNIIAKRMHMVVALCYEIIFNQQLRDNITDETDYILTLSNDAWFGDSIGPLQHMEIARMRALEFGMPVIRSTNNGVTAVTDYRGNIVAALPQFEEAVLKTEVVPTTGTTPFVMFGNAPLKTAVASLLTGFLLLNIRKKKQ